jgi:choline dehydrogenase-like flavoprotein
VKKPVSLLAARRLPQLVRWLAMGRGPLTSSVAEAVAFVHTRPGLAGPDLELLFAPVMFVDEGLRHPPGHGLTVGAVALAPSSRGSVRLRSKDPFEAPLIDPGYLTDADASNLGVLMGGLRMARTIIASTAFDPFRADEYLPGASRVAGFELANAIRLHAQTLYHPACTCRMGNNDDAVCDTELRVRGGLQGLRVVDASAMPVLVRAHPNAAVTMMAERVAALMRGEPPARVL